MSVQYKRVVLHPKLFSMVFNYLVRLFTECGDIGTTWIDGCVNAVRKLDSNNCGKSRTMKTILFGKEESAVVRLHIFWFCYKAVQKMCAYFDNG